MSVQIPAGHAPIDWNNWQPPVEGDVRSPCPMLNLLANHNILPHSGKGITKEAVMDALTTSINLGPKIADTFASKAVTMNPDGKGTSFDLDHLAKHGPIEHDSSLSRSDFHLGDNHTYNHEVWSDTMESYGDNEMTNFKLASRARYARLMKCKKEHEAVGRSFRYGVIEFILSYGETALFLGILGDPVNGKIPVSYVKALFEEERMPVKEGWTRLPKPLVQNDMNWLMFHLFMANDHKFDELRQIGVGSITGAMSFMSDNTSGKCTVM